jgi:hypothetical protein
MNTGNNGFVDSGNSPPKSKRKLSWQYHDLASKIQLAPRKFAATELLRFLGKAANDGGTSHHGYASLAANTGIRKLDNVRIAIQYLLTVGIAEVKQPILTRKTGVGKNTSHYKLHLGAMQAVVKHQGIFDEAGKLIRHTKWERLDGIPVTGTPAEEVYPQQGDGIPVTGTPGIPVTGTRYPRKGVTNPQEPPIKNPKENSLNRARPKRSFVLSSSGPVQANPVEMDGTARDSSAAPIPVEPAATLEMQPAGQNGWSACVHKMARHILESLAQHGDGVPETIVKSHAFKSEDDDAYRGDAVDGAPILKPEQVYRTTMDVLTDKGQLGRPDVRLSDKRLYRLPYVPAPPKPIVPVEPLGPRLKPEHGEPFVPSLKLHELKELVHRVAHAMEDDIHAYVCHECGTVGQSEQDTCGSCLAVYDPRDKDEIFVLADALYPELVGRLHDLETTEKDAHAARSLETKKAKLETQS